MIIATILLSSCDVISPDTYYRIGYDIDTKISENKQDNQLMDSTLNENVDYNDFVVSK